MILLYLFEYIIYMVMVVVCVCVCSIFIISFNSLSLCCCFQLGYCVCGAGDVIQSLVLDGIVLCAQVLLFCCRH